MAAVAGPAGAVRRIREGADLGQPSRQGCDIAFGDIEAARKAVGPETAAILVEPVQGEGGIRVASAQFLKDLRELCDKHELLLLLDEVQDTSPAQWEIADRLTEEFFAGEGARDGARTIFAVGDRKQSIFSFQGAEPAEFDRQAKRLGNLAGEAFRDVSLDVSFRSAARWSSAATRSRMSFSMV